MSEYIEREALLSAAKGYDWIAGLKTVMKRIPAADVRPVVRGKWEEEDSASNRWAFRCSVCKGGPVGFKFRFCPNCGADMREGS